MKLTNRQRYWLEQIKACEASGMSASAYAAEQGFRVGGMYAGKKSLIRKGVLPQAQGARFQRVQPVAVSVDNEWRIRLPNGVWVDFSGTVDAGSLSTVLNTVARLG
ncbi:MAG: hypothetical protein IID58_12520 [Proteobacteria bacterium]|nr:hypothetical protein [Pseudomonadota bacterium]